MKFELLVDLETEPAGATVIFDDCEQLGAANLRGTGFAARDVEVRRISAKDGGVWRTVEVNVTGLAGFLLAKVAAAHGRRKAKDWYDIAFVLLHNDAGGPRAAVRLVLDTFGADLGGLTTALQDLAANFSDPRAQGPTATPGSSSSTTPGKIPRHSRQTHWLPSRRSARHCFGTSPLLDSTRSSTALITATDRSSRGAPGLATSRRTRR